MGGDYISAVPVGARDPPKDLTLAARTVKGALPKYWDRGYVNQHIQSVNNHQHKMLLQFLWMSGVRITEAVSLKKQDLDFQNYTMNVLWQKSRKYSRRIVPLHPRLRELLQLYTATMRLEDRVFPITRQRAWQLTQKYLGGHPHQLRHSFAVNWLRSGGDLVVLHKILGHSKIQTTMEYLNIVRPTKDENSSRSNSIDHSVIPSHGPTSIHPRTR